MGLTKPRAYQIYDIDYKQATRVATITNTTLSGGAPNVVDGVTLTLNDRVLVAGQGTGSENGLYYVTTVGSGSNGTWSRSVDGDQQGEINAGLIVMVTEGNVYVDTQWKLTTNDPIVIGVTPLTFVFNALNVYFTSISAGGNVLTASGNASVVNFAAGSGMSITGNTVSNTITFTSTGGGGGTSISNGTSNVNVVSSGGNVTVGVSGVGNVVVWAPTGEYVTGVVSASGNVTGGNLIATGYVQSANGLESTSTYPGPYSDGIVVDYLTGTGRISVGSGDGLAVYNGGIASTLMATFSSGGQFSAVGNVVGSNFTTTGLISASGNITSGNISSGNISATNHIGTNVSVTGVVTAASTVGGVITGTSTSVTGIQTAASTVGGVMTGASLSVTGNVTALNHFGTNTSVTGTQTAASTVGGVITGSSTSVTGAVSGASASVSGAVTAASTVGGIITGSSASVTGIVTGSSHVGSVVSVTGAITGASVVGGVITGTSTSVTGNTTAGNLIATTYVMAGNGLESTSTYPGPYTDGIVIDYLTGNGRISTGAADGLNIFNGGVANTLIASFNTTGALTLGTTGTANLTGGNVLASGNISATGNLTIGSGTGGNLSGANVISANTFIASANITSGNILTGGLISATSTITSAANITAAAYYGPLANTTSNININNAAGNAAVSIGGTANVAVFSNTGAYLTLASANGLAGVTALKLTAGTFATAPQAGSMNYDGTVFRMTAATGNESVTMNSYFYRPAANVALANVATAQSWLGAGVTVQSNVVYQFNGLFNLVTTGTTSHTEAIGFGGTATLINIGYLSIRGNANAITATTGNVYSVYHTSNASTVQTGAFTTAQNVYYQLSGTVSSNVTGTFIPQLTFSAAPGGTSTVVTGAYFQLTPLQAGSGNVNIGTWA